MANNHDFLDQVQRYISEHRRDGLAAYNISGIYDLLPGTQPSTTDLAYKWPESWPNASNAGVYAIFGSDMTLLYVGKSSMNSFLGARLSSYFGYTPERTCRIKGEWSISPRYLMTVAVPDDATWEAPALEEFLVQRLNPSLNKNGRSS
jgi:hypothetical protein